MTTTTAAARAPRPYLNPYAAGTLLGVVLFLSFYVTGGGLGASAALNRIEVGVLDWFAPGHVDRVAYLAEMAGGARSAWNYSGMFMLVGTALGGLASGLVNRRVKLELRKGPNVTTRVAVPIRGPFRSSSFTRRFTSPEAKPPSTVPAIMKMA